MLNKVKHLAGLIEILRLRLRMTAFNIDLTILLPDRKSVKATFSPAIMPIIFLAPDDLDIDNIIHIVNNHFSPVVSSFCRDFIASAVSSDFLFVPCWSTSIWIEDFITGLFVLL